jgi:tetratricopeptide (TPR) repeat protein
LEFLTKSGDTAKAADVHHRLARELYDLNQLPAALASYETALGGFDLVADALGQARVERGIGLFHLEGSYDRVAAVAHFSEALRLWPSGREDAELGWLLLEASRARFYTGDCAAAGILADRGLAIAAMW